MPPTKESPTRSVKAALGQPDSDNGWQVGSLFVPYLSFSQRELDEMMDLDLDRNEAIDAGGKSDRRVFAAVVELRPKEYALYAQMFNRRMRGELTGEQLYGEESVTNEDLSAWRTRTASGGQDPKAPPAAVVASATGPTSPPSSPT
ncbi:hypothetical protein GCM10022631_11380 [Deinococcus rubellus]|uniref:hypothetical protein n=1 Tax=Deinococcus rubellus TaxID=1889240 RepID=UPI0031EE8F74